MTNPDESDQPTPTAEPPPHLTWEEQVGWVQGYDAAKAALPFPDEAAYQDWLNELMENAGDEWDGDESMEAIAIKYVRDLEAKADAIAANSVTHAPPINKIGSETVWPGRVFPRRNLGEPGGECEHAHLTWTDGDFECDTCGRRQATISGQFGLDLLRAVDENNRLRSLLDDALATLAVADQAPELRAAITIALAGGS